MGFYILKRNRLDTWDENRGLLVRADSEKEAREVATHFDNSEEWLDENAVRIEEVAVVGKAEVVFTDWHDA